MFELVAAYSLKVKVSLELFYSVISYSSMRFRIEYTIAYGNKIQFGHWTEYAETLKQSIDCVLIFLTSKYTISAKNQSEN